MSSGLGCNEYWLARLIEEFVVAIESLWFEKSARENIDAALDDTQVALVEIVPIVEIELRSYSYAGLLVLSFCSYDWKSSWENEVEICGSCSRG
jgi:hypothetical protein